MTKMTMRTITGSFTDAKAYEGHVYGISVLTGSGANAVEVLVVASTPEAVAQAINSAWPGQPVDLNKTRPVLVVPRDNFEDDEEI